MKNGYQVIDLQDVVLIDSGTSTIKKYLISQLANCENKPLRFVNAYLEEDGIAEPVLYGFVIAIGTKDYIVKIGGVFWFELDISAWDGESDISITTHYGDYAVNPVINGSIIFGDDSVLDKAPKKFYLHKITLSKTAPDYSFTFEVINDDKTPLSSSNFTSKWSDYMTASARAVNYRKTMNLCEMVFLNFSGAPTISSQKFEIHGYHTDTSTWSYNEYNAASVEDVVTDLF